MKLKNTSKMILLGIGFALSSTVAEARYAAMHAASQPDMWSGSYVGAYFGSGSGDVDHSYAMSQNSIATASKVFIVLEPPAQTFAFLTGAGSPNGNLDGSTADLFVGYNYVPHWWHSRFLLGAQLEGNFFVDGLHAAVEATSTLNGQSRQSNQPTLVSVLTQTVPYVADTQLLSMFSLLGRLGFLVNPSILIYGLGGGTWVHSSPAEVPYIGSVEGITSWNTGYTAGAGLEYRFNERWSMRGEYRFYSVDINQSFSELTESTTTTVDSSGQEASRGTSTATFTHIDLKNTINFNMGKVGVVYRF